MRVFLTTTKLLLPVGLFCVVYLLAQNGKVGMVNPNVVVSVEDSTQETLVEVKVRNYGITPVRVTNVESSCNCATVDNLPINIPPFGVRPISMNIDCSKLSLPAQQSFLVYTEPPNERLFANASLEMEHPD